MALSAFKVLVVSVLLTVPRVSCPWLEKKSLGQVQLAVTVCVTDTSLGPQTPSLFALKSEPEARNLFSIHLLRGLLGRSGARALEKLPGCLPYVATDRFEHARRENELVPSPPLVCIGDTVSRWWWPLHIMFASDASRS